MLGKEGGGDDKEEEEDDDDEEEEEKEGDDDDEEEDDDDEEEERTEHDLDRCPPVRIIRHRSVRAKKHGYLQVQFFTEWTCHWVNAWEFKYNKKLFTVPDAPNPPPEKGYRYIRWNDSWVDFTVFGDLKQKALKEYLGDVENELTDTRVYDDELRYDIVQVKFKKRTQPLWVPAHMIQTD